MIYLIYLSTVDDLVTHLPFGDIVEGLHSMDPTQETWARSCHTGPIRQHELDHTDHTDHTRSGKNLCLGVSGWWTLGVICRWSAWSVPEVWNVWPLDTPDRSFRLSRSRTRCSEMMTLKRRITRIPPVKNSSVRAVWIIQVPFDKSCAMQISASKTWSTTVDRAGPVHHLSDPKYLL